MTTVNVKISGREARLEVHGHAGFKRTSSDNDIVCAAVSTLAHTFVRHTKKLFEAGVIEQVSEFRHEPEHVIVGVVIADTADAKTRVNEMVEFAVTGYERLAEAYPNNVQMALDY